MKASLAALSPFGLLVGLWAAPCAAQTDGPGPGAAWPSTAAQPTGQPGEGVLQEVVVTAQRQSENLQKVPMSVTAVSGAELVAQHIFEPSELEFLAPSLKSTSYQESPGATNFSIRGVGNLEFLHTIQPSVVNVIDDVPMARAEMAILDFVDIAQIEVLNGPQGTLFGRNASAGVINITTTRPVLGTFSASGHLEYGSVDAASDIDTWLIQTTVNIPLAQTMALRLNYSYSDQGPLLQAPVAYPGADGGKQQHVGRAKLLWEPTDRLKVYIAGDYASSRGLGAGTASLRSATPGDLNTAPPLGTLGVVPGPDNLTEIDGLAALNAGYTVGGGQINIDYKVDDKTTISSITAWRRFTQFFGGSEASPGYQYIANPSTFKFTQFSQEIRVASDLGPLFHFQAGIYYFDGQFDRNTYAFGSLGYTTPAGYRDFIGIFDFTGTDEESIAGYAQGTFNVTSRLHLTGGVRVTHDDTKYSGYDQQQNFYIPLVTPANYIEHDAYTKASWKASAQYDVTDRTMAYATAATGYKGSGYDLALSGATQVNPEDSRLYEVGVKSLFLDGHLRFNSALYYERFTGFQTQAINPATPLISLPEVTNAALVTSKGVEAKLDAAVSEHLSLSAGVEYNKTRFGSFIDSPCYGGQTLAEGCVDNLDNVTGNALPQAPDWTVTLGGEYRQPISGTLRLILHSDYYYQSRIYFQQQNQPASMQPGYGLVNVSLALAHIDDRWRVAVFCRNCADKRFTTTIYPTSFVPTDYQQNFGLSSFRTIGVSLDARI